MDINLDYCNTTSVGTLRVPLAIICKNEHSHISTNTQDKFIEPFNYYPDSQTGSPTSAYSLARFIYFLIINKTDFGIYHFTDKGEVSWYAFSKKIIENYCSDMINLISPVKKKK